MTSSLSLHRTDRAQLLVYKGGLLEGCVSRGPVSSPAAILIDATRLMDALKESGYSYQLHQRPSLLLMETLTPTTLHC